MGVYQRHERGGAWYYRFKLDKVPYKGACVMPNGKPAINGFQAMQCEAAAREAVLQNTPLPNHVRADLNPKEATLEEAYAWHVAKIEADASETHLASFGRYAREALEFFGEGRKLSKIGDQDCREFRAAVIRRKRRVFIGGPEAADRSEESLWKELGKVRSASECNHVLNALRSALTGAAKLRDRDGRPMLAYVPVIKKVHEPKRIPTPMSTDEMQRRRAVAPPWVQDAIDLARHFGMRLSEALNVKVRHLDFERRVITFQGEQVKSGHDQDLHTTPEGWAIAKRLARQARERGVDHLITWPVPATTKRQRIVNRQFGPGGVALPAASIEWKPLKSIRRAWNQTAIAAGIDNPRRFHDLRAAYVTEVAQHEKSAKKIQKIARHAAFATTERYINIADSELVGVMDNVAARRRGPLTMPAPANSSGARRPTPAKHRKAR